MWKEYSSSYIKNNRTSGISVMAAAFISALLLSLLCGLFYNLWKYEVERIELEEGGWQSRLVGELDEGEIESIKNYANIEDVVIRKDESRGQETVVDLYFKNMRSVFADSPRIAQLAGVEPESITYNYELLAMYLIRDSQDTAPRLVFPFFLLVTVLASFSLIVIIHNAFAVSMNARIHQFGIFSSIGATPRQIRTCLLQEAAALCALPILVGNLLGIGLSMGFMEMTNILLDGKGPGRHEAVFGYHPLVLAATLLVTVITVWISAWLPARKLSRLTPLQAIKNTGDLQLKRKKNSPVLTLLFGLEGQLAGNALKAQKKATRTASLSLIISFMAFTLMQCFFTLSAISTRETYFEKYENAWDIMVTIKDTDVDALEETETIRSFSQVADVAAYQKATAKRRITQEEMSQELKDNGGFSHDSQNQVSQMGDGWLVNAPIIILDDESFLTYCQQIGVSPSLDGAVILNQIRDVTNPDFRHPQYMPYVNEADTSLLIQSGNEESTAEIPVLCYTEQVPVLREEYATLDYYELVHFIPVSLWETIKDTIGGAQEDSFLRILGTEPVTLEGLNSLQKEIHQLMGQKYQLESENRIQATETNNTQIQGMMAIFSSFCILLATIGITNVFSYTLGFVRQRRREFARYMSVGLTPANLKKMFFIEALVIAGRPVLFTLPLAVISVGYMLQISYMEAETFFAEAPLVPIAVFILVILAAVALAYYLGWRNVRKISLAESLRDDTMM